jgi:Flp pilus assembly protein TadG
MNLRNSQRGATIAEAAITLMVLFTLLFAVLEFGRAFNIYQIMTNAAREGARYAVAPDPGNSYQLPTPANVAARVCGYLQSGNVYPTGGSTCSLGVGGPTCSPAGGGPIPAAATAGVYVQNCVKPVYGINTNFTEVDIKVPFRFFVLPFTVNMTTRAEMRNESTTQTYGN